MKVEVSEQEVQEIGRNRWWKANSKKVFRYQIICIVVILICGFASLQVSNKAARTVILMIPLVGFAFVMVKSVLQEAKAGKDFLQQQKALRAK